MPKDIHVYPIRDIKKHDTKTRLCACKPRVEIVSEGLSEIVIHNSWDGREEIERAKARADKLRGAIDNVVN